MTNIRTGFSKTAINKEVSDFNSSIGVDSAMFREDIAGSIAHAEMLAETGIIGKDDGAKIVAGLKNILADLEAGKLEFDPNAEDIHMFIESQLGEAGKRLHTARSRNDQVALDTRLYAVKKIDLIKAEIKNLINVLVKLAEENLGTVMPCYTHLQKAQPSTLAHYLCAYASMLLRDLGRLSDCRKRTNISPLGSCALAGTTYPIDRKLVAKKLNMDGVTINSMDGVSDRDFAIELASTVSIIMIHLSRFAEEIIIWNSAEFKYVVLDDAYATGSSIMPQKKNPDVAELVRGKTGRVFGNLIALLTVMKGLPLAYNKDMQEDKEALFDSIDTALLCLPVFAKMLETAKFNKVVMKESAESGFINSTDCADYLTKKGMPFRTAYDLVGKEIIAYCMKNNKTLNSLTLAEYKSFSELFTDDIFKAIDLTTCVNTRNSDGAVSEKAVKAQIEAIKAGLKND
jgi:argininosuccinate lyase